MNEKNFDKYKLNPTELFLKWLALAKEKEPSNHNAMALSTVTSQGRPNVRMVLLKNVDERGFVFYTNYGSHKARALLQNPFAELCFYWKSLDRQVRVSGAAEQISDEEADEYFYSRPRGSRIGAWASDQSQPVHNHDVFKKHVESVEARFANEDHIPRPPYWSGFRIKPDRIEFWIEQPYRLHKRYVFVKKSDDIWSGGWLYP